MFKMTLQLTALDCWRCV